MYMRTLSLFTILAGLSLVKGQKEEWLCNCTTKGVSDEKLTTQCCEAAPGVLVSLPPPPVRDHSLVSMLILPPLESPLLTDVNFKCTASVWPRWQSSRGPGAKLR
jgi:hypothetical protein